MRRRGVGIGAVRKKQEQAKQFTEVGDQLAESQMAHVATQLESFKVNLEQFAIKYKNNIKKDPEFRKMFQIMCARIGVDPLASKKGFWSELLDVGDFYYELAVQIIEVCIITRCGHDAGAFGRECVSAPRFPAQSSSCFFDVG